MDIIKPKRLAINQTIGIVAPASPPRDGSVIALWLERIRELGFQVKEGKHLYDRFGYLAGFDKDRAADINQMFADKEVDAIYTNCGSPVSCSKWQELSLGALRSTRRGALRSMKSSLNVSLP